MSDLTTAVKIACEAHANQKDKAGEPYILHPLRLMQRLKNKDNMIVAVLHDVIEDSQFDFSFLEAKGFDKGIIKAVDALTKRDGEAYRDFIERLSFNDMAVSVKIEDLKDNLDLTRLACVKDKDLERIKKYHKALIFLEKKRS
jgi:(p)ppGpp synthase/HD superfamily hydrolase